MAAGSRSGGGVLAELCSQCPESKDLAVKWKSKSLGRIQTKHLLARYQSGETAVGRGGGGGDAAEGTHGEEARGRDVACEGLKVSFPPSIHCVPILPAMCLKSFLLSPENIYSTRR